MERFRTRFGIPAFRSPLTYQTPSLFIGSCFTESIGGKLRNVKFPVDINPFGVIFNPISVKNSLEILIHAREFSKDDLHYFNRQWISFSHQTSFSDPDPETCLNIINQGILQSSRFLKRAGFLFITFGTAWVYEWEETGQVVSNCHKIPEKEFSRRLLDPDDITRSYQELLDKLTSFNPELKIIFTVSPIRHWKDGAEGNQISKATLLLSIHQLKKNFPEIDYFPAYEIVMDDLRDYRFYAEDMLHLDPVAVDYIWERFRETFIGRENQKIVSELEKILSAYHHRPMKPDSEAHRRFLRKNFQKVRDLKSQYPFLDLDRELEHFGAG